MATSVTCQFCPRQFFVSCAHVDQSSVLSSIVATLVTRQFVVVVTWVIRQFFGNCGHVDYSSVYFNYGHVGHFSVVATSVTRQFVVATLVTRQFFVSCNRVGYSSVIY